MLPRTQYSTHSRPQTVVSRKGRDAHTRIHFSQMSLRLYLVCRPWGSSTQRLVGTNPQMTTSGQSTHPGRLKVNSRVPLELSPIRTEPHFCGDYFRIGGYPPRTMPMAPKTLEKPTYLYCLHWTLSCKRSAGRLVLQSHQPFLGMRSHCHGTTYRQPVWRALAHR